MYGVCRTHSVRRRAGIFPARFFRLSGSRVHPPHHARVRLAKQVWEDDHLSQAKKKHHRVQKYSRGLVAKWGPLCFNRETATAQTLGTMQNQRGRAELNNDPSLPKFTAVHTEPLFLY